MSYEEKYTRFRPKGYDFIGFSMNGDKLLSFNINIDIIVLRSMKMTNHYHLN